MTVQETALLEWANAYYSPKEFEYLNTGAKRLPLIVDLQALANRFASTLTRVVDTSVRAYLRGTANGW